MIECIIVDDEPLAVDLIAGFVERVPHLTLVGKFYSAEDALVFLEGRSVDLIFLDVSLPALSGLEVPHLLSAGIRVVYITAHRNYAVEAFEKNASDYLLKPVTFERFLQAVDKVKLSVHDGGTRVVRKEKLFVKSGTRLVSIALSDIVCIEGMGDYVILHRGAEKIVVSKRMKDLEDQLITPFFRVHLSYIVNIDRIDKIEENHIFIGVKRIPISAKYREAFLSAVERRLL